MRKFYLHTYDKSYSFDLNGTRALATEPSGLGNSFQTSYKESDKGNHLTNVKPKFDNITLKIYFNADGTDGYANYKGLLSFLTMCGMSKFIFEYNDGVTDKYCDVILKTHTKGEISEEGVFCEKFVFERQTYWYESIEETFAFTEIETDPSYPLEFPFDFQGSVFNSEFLVKNPFYESAPIFIKISGAITRELKIYIKSSAGEVISQIDISEDLPTGTTVTINPTDKKITMESADGSISNGYGLTDKTKQSFLYLPQGEYKIGANIVRGTNGKIEISIKRYLLD